MKAIVYTKYGAPEDVLELKEVEKPTPKDGEVLVKIFAASINWADEAAVRGKPFLVRATHGLLKPKNKILGTDIAGQVESVGRDVEQFQPGDEVFGDIGGFGFGAFAEYVSVPENTLALKPVNLTYEEAAAVPQYAVVALQGLRDKGQIQPGKKVLINGASGGIGTFAVQIAKSFGAEVTGVCSTRNLDMVRSIGADHVIDYTKEDFTQKEQQYDLILDIVTNHPVSDNIRALSPTGSYVAVAFSTSALLSRGSDGKKVVQLSHKPNVNDLMYMKELIEVGKVVPIVAKSFPLSEAADAIRYYGEEHPAGKVVITVEHDVRA
ncbi:MAG: NAD(P)-dependent alcohol dehydrogenase [Chloroflexi bacterium]|nr:NAD(P)-dependent alcohol dehydrogenase [Chloroflexota bacterium]MBL7079305.1 NAD(P)-dependent alcohol dehydrogenase [Candidatus Bathyarchaeota archaeon]